jgi:hypothetical protein
MVKVWRAGVHNKVRLNLMAKPAGRTSLLKALEAGVYNKVRHNSTAKPTCSEDLWRLVSMILWG